jgi:hypothetical protein
MLNHWEALASRAVIAAIVLAPVGGPSFELLYLDGGDDKDDEAGCREMTRRGLRPIALLAWTGEGKLEWEWNGTLLTWPRGSVDPVLRAARSEFLGRLASLSGPTN